MDQQFDEYEKWIKNAWQKVQSSILVGFSKRDRILLLIITVIMLWGNGDELIYLIRLIPIDFEYVMETTTFNAIGFTVYSVFQFALPILTLVGLVYLLLSKRKGWILVLNAFSLGIVYRFSQLISMFGIEREIVDSSLILNVDSYFYPSLSDWIIWFAVYVLCFGYFLSKPVKMNFGIERKQVLSSFGLTAIFLLIDTALTLISL